MSEITKIDIVAGFLGAGKTTLINRLLKEVYSGEKVALLENEFGEISVDADLLRGEDHELLIKEIAAGCICCTLHGSFLSGLAEIVKNYAPTRIIVEPTGLARLSEVLALCRQAAQTLPVAIHTVVSIVDIHMIPVFREVGGEIYAEQLRSAPVILLSHTDEPEEGLSMHEQWQWLRAVNGQALIFDLADPALDCLVWYALAEEAWSQQNTPPVAASAAHHAHTHEHEQTFSSVAVILEQSCEKAAIEALLDDFRQGKYGEVYRAKGLLNSAGSAFRFDYVYGKSSFATLPPVAAGKIIVIGDHLHEGSLRNRLLALMQS